MPQARQRAPDVHRSGLASAVSHSARAADAPRRRWCRTVAATHRQQEHRGAGRDQDVQASARHPDAYRPGAAGSASATCRSSISPLFTT